MTIEVNKSLLGKLIPPILLLILASILILPKIGGQHLWQDEAQTALVSRTILRHGIPQCHDEINSFSQELGSECGNNGVFKWHPWAPFYIHAAFYWIGGESDFVSRLPDALFGIATIILVFFTAQSLGLSTRAALVSSLILLGMVSFLLLSRQCRYYTIAAFFTLSGLYCYLGFLKDRHYTAILMVISALLLFHTQIIYCVVFCLFIWCHLCLTRPLRWKKRLLIVSSIPILGIPWLLYISDIPYRARYGETTLDIQTCLINLTGFSSLLSRNVIPLYFLLFLVLVLLLRLRRKLRTLPDHAGSLVFTGSYILVSLVVISLFAPAPFFRYLAAILPLFAILTGQMVEWCFTTHKLIGLGGFLLLISIQPYRDYLHEMTHRFTGPMEGIVSYLHENADKEDVVAITYGDMPVKWYTGLRVVGGLAGDDLRPAKNARWIIIRKHVNCLKDYAVAVYLQDNVPLEHYRKIVIDAPDTRYQNRESIPGHLFETAFWEDNVVIYERIDK